MRRKSSDPNPFTHNVGKSTISGLAAAFSAAPRRRQSAVRDYPFTDGMVARVENGLVASITNMTKALRSLVPLLDTCIGVLGGCPGMD